MKNITKGIVFLLLFGLLLSMVRPVGVSAKRTTRASTTKGFEIVGAAECKEQWIHIESKKQCIIRFRGYWGELLWSSDWCDQNLEFKWWRIRGKNVLGKHYEGDYWLGDDVYWIEAKSISGEYTLVYIDFEGLD